MGMRLDGLSLSIHRQEVLPKEEGKDVASNQRPGGSRRKSCLRENTMELGGNEIKSYLREVYEGSETLQT